MLAALLLPSLLAPGVEPPVDAVKLNTPRVENRANEASATTSPWIDANGWRILRSPDLPFSYRVKGDAAGLAAAEAFTYGARASISADAPGAVAFGRMLTFLKAVPSLDLQPVADFGVVDDGSDASGELLNLLTRMNLLYKVEKNPDRSFRLNVKPGEGDPSFAAHKIRSEIGDENRSLRVFGSEVVIARLLSGPRGARVFVLNYAGRPVRGLRVRVRRVYSKGELRAFGSADSRLADFGSEGAATEFTIPELHALAVIDLVGR